jgi:tRNA pseudouridine38-40 synthase
MNAYNWVPALNTKLPATIRIMACEEVAADFHSRFSATGKIYHYDLCTEPVLPPFKAGLVASSAFAGCRRVGTSARTCSSVAMISMPSPPIVETSCRTWIGSAASTARSSEALADGYRITFVGDGFLYKMVRLLTGAAVHAAQGRIRIDDLATCC